MSGHRLVVVGATGSTGQRVLRLAADAGLRPVAVGRRAEARAAITAELDVEIRVASLVADELDIALADAAVVVAAIGPSTQFGPDLLAAALRAGAHWIDFSGEPRWVQQLATEFDGPAREAQVWVCSGTQIDSTPARSASWAKVPMPTASAVTNRNNPTFSGFRPFAGPPADARRPNQKSVARLDASIPRRAKLCGLARHSPGRESSQPESSAIVAIRARSW